MTEKEKALRNESGHPMLSSLQSERTKKGKIVSAEEAIRVIRDGDTVATSGFVGTGFPEEVAIKLEDYFLETGKPRDLTLVYAAGQGDGAERGLNHFGHEGLVKRVIGGHWALVPKLQNWPLKIRLLPTTFPRAWSHICTGTLVPINPGQSLRSVLEPLWTLETAVEKLMN